MRTIIGIGRKNSAFCLFFVLILRGSTACRHAAEAPPTFEIVPKAQVTVAHISTGNMLEQVPLSAVSAYVQRNVVTAPVPCFLAVVRVKLGQTVRKGDVLYELESKERKALGNAFDSDTTFARLGKITIYAPINGIITTLDRQQTGDYVAEGSPLCTITENQSIVFQLNVPYEYNRFTHLGNHYTIILPDKRLIQAQLTLPLTTVNPLAQTQQFWLKPDGQIFLPEGLIATVMLTLNQKGNAQMLPKEAVLSDELLKDFWIMKLIDDSTAVKIPVVLGMKNVQQVEIVSPKFSSQDAILTTGNYGLADTAAVRVVKE